jgi:hypothetical protein
LPERQSFIGGLHGLNVAYVAHVLNVPANPKTERGGHAEKIFPTRNVADYRKRKFAHRQIFAILANEPRHDFERGARARVAIGEGE